MASDVSDVELYEFAEAAAPYNDPMRKKPLSALGFSFQYADATGTGSARATIREKGDNKSRS